MVWFIIGRNGGIYCYWPWPRLNQTQNLSCARPIVTCLWVFLSLTYKLRAESRVFTQIDIPQTSSSHQLRSDWILNCRTFFLSGYSCVLTYQPRELRKVQYTCVRELASKKTSCLKLLYSNCTLLWFISNDRCLPLECFDYVKLHQLVLAASFLQGVYMNAAYCLEPSRVMRAV